MVRQERLMIGQHQKRSSRVGGHNGAASRSVESRRSAIIGGQLILRLVQSEPGWNARRLAKRLKVCEKTIYRYLKDLAAAGVDIEHDRRSGGYRLMQPYIPPPVQLTEEEAFALAAMCQEIGGQPQIAHLKPVASALRKIKETLPRDVRENLDAVAPHVVMKMAAAGRGDGRDEAAYRTIRQALRERRVLECCYESLKGEDSEEVFEFEPYSLFFAVRAWYCVGRHSRRADLRSLKLKRFTKIAMLPGHYEIPVDFSLREHLGNAWSMIRGEPEHDVEIWIDPAFRATLSDTRWHHTQYIEQQADGSAIFRCRVSGLEEIVWWVLGLGPRARVINPPALAERVHQLAGETAAAYSR
jgi:predicted DNA-binding transcriptional regulator YafY